MEVDEQLEENDNGVDNSDEHMDGVEATGDIGSGEDDSESGEGSSCGGEVGDYGYEEKKTPGLMRRWTARRKKLTSLTASQTCNLSYYILYQLRIFKKLSLDFPMSLQNLLRPYIHSVTLVQSYMVLDSLMSF